MFGTRGPDGKPRPFDLYSMRQAIEEGFILDVLQNYTIFETYFKLVKSIESDPRYKASKANPALMGVAQWNPVFLERKAAIVVEHFVNEIAGDLHGKAKAMVVTSSRLMALRFYRAITDYAQAHHYNLGVLAAFSGTVVDGSEEWTEARVNGFAESQTAEKFDTDAYRIMVVANKYQTGFDQPKLEAMYVDKMLTGVAAVQTLSRLNRCYPDKRTCVVDFVNDAETIQASFATYYGATTIDCVTDPNVVYNLKERLDEFGVYEQREVEAVARIWFDGAADPDEALRKVESRLAPAHDRWKALEEPQQKEFKGYLKKFLRTYGFVTQMIALGDEELHRFAAYGGLLIRKLFLPTSESVDLRGKVQLEYLRFKDAGTIAIPLDESELHNGAATPGLPNPEEKEALSKLVEEMNARFATNFTDADKIIRACKDKIMEDEDFKAKARSNSMSDLAAVFGEVWKNALASVVSQSSDMLDIYMRNEKACNEMLGDHLLPIVYRACNE